jgi:hypothetical protein
MMKQHSALLTWCRNYVITQIVILANVVTLCVSFELNPDFRHLC